MYSLIPEWQRRALVLLYGLTAGLTCRADSVGVSLDGSVTRPWIGAAIWANPMEDWMLESGAARNTHSGGNRELVLLTAELNDKPAGFEVAARFTPQETPSGKGFIGFQLGLCGDFADYRDSAVYGVGFAAGIRADGRLFIGEVVAEQPSRVIGTQPLDLRLVATPEPDGMYALTLGVADVSEVVCTTKIHSSWLRGLVSFTVSSEPPNPVRLGEERPPHLVAINQQRGGSWRASITAMRASGDKISALPDRRFGPVLWCQHTLEHGGRLNLLAQFAPVDAPEPAALWIDGAKMAEAAIDPFARVAAFHVSDLDTTSEHHYEVRWGDDSYAGIIRREPLEKPVLTVAAMSCNDSTGFPHNLLVENITAQHPDIVAFLGDQIYEPIGGYGLLVGKTNTSRDDRSILCYLRKYYLHGWAWRDVLRDTPAIVTPDDHDVFHGNVWGSGGKLADRSNGAGAAAQDSGGYKMSVDFVNAVQLGQTGNLPPPVDPKPCDSGISVYFTNWVYGGVDMAILADRQFKSAPKALLPDSGIVNGWPQNKAKQRPGLTAPEELDVPAAELLGPRQEAFLDNWAKRNHAGNWRLVFSATPFMCLQSIPADEYSDDVVPSLPRMKPGQYPDTDIPKVDYDSNGWPQSKRDRAVASLTSAGAVHVTGDQHLGSTGQYGVKEFNDSAWWISSPAIANLWPRRWFPKDGGANRLPGAPKYTGELEDGFGNRITLHAAANPYDIDREPARLYDKAVGYAVLSLDRPSGHITLAVWPYYSSPVRPVPDNQPYPGWPITIDPKTNQRLK